MVASWVGIIASFSALWLLSLTNLITHSEPLLFDGSLPLFVCFSIIFSAQAFDKLI